MQPSGSLFSLFDLSPKNRASGVKKPLSDMTDRPEKYLERIKKPALNDGFL